MASNDTSLGLPETSRSLDPSQLDAGVRGHLPNFLTTDACAKWSTRMISSILKGLRGGRTIVSERRNKAPASSRASFHSSLFERTEGPMPRHQILREALDKMTQPLNFGRQLRV